MRRAWIEILLWCYVLLEIIVALHAESVDRNCLRHTCYICDAVALHAESVDRNIKKRFLFLPTLVALHAESVDRNLMQTVHDIHKAVALHAESVDRNIYVIPILGNLLVALHAESVDRNRKCGRLYISCLWSLSMRRAWIEIVIFDKRLEYASSSLSMRRAWIEIFNPPKTAANWASRSPCGERG